MMKTKKARGKNVETESAVIRASISFPLDVYETLGLIAKEKKISLAWVVREAAERYITNKGSLSVKNK